MFIDHWYEWVVGNPRTSLYRNNDESAKKYALWCAEIIENFITLNALQVYILSSIFLPLLVPY